MSPRIGIGIDIPASKSSRRSTTFILTSTGDGSGVSTIQLIVSEDTEMTIDGAGKFYDDAAGTTNEGTTRIITAGATRTFYLKVPSGTANLVIKGVKTLTGFNNWTSSTNAASLYINVKDLPSSLTYFLCEGSNTVSGDIASLPSGLTYFLCYGSNTVSGDIGTLPSGMTYFRCTGSNTISTYTSPHTFSSSITYMLCLPAAGYGLDSTEVDNLLIDLDNSGMSSGTIDLAGNNAPRTAASDTAVTNLIDRGVSVSTS